MKIERIKQIIKEEINNILNEEAPKPRYEKGDKFAYRGIGYTVISDDGYVVKAIDRNGKEAMLNYNQLNQGVWKKPDYLNEDKKGVSLEELPGYDSLPEKREDINWADWRNRKELDLPSAEGIEGVYDVIHSKEEAQKWKNDFINNGYLKPEEKNIIFDTTEKWFTIINGTDKYNEKIKMRKYN